MAAKLDEAVRQYVISKRSEAPISVEAAIEAIAKEFPVDHILSDQELAEMVEDEALVKRIPVH
jgi:hypothetical protein